MKEKEPLNKKQLEDKKELMIESLKTMQLLIGALTDSQAKELSDILSTLTNAANEITSILNPSDDNDDFYTELYN